MSEEKLKFILTCPERFKALKAEDKGVWGVMNAQQMLEHLSDSVRIANGKDLVERSHTPEERLPAFREFMMSEKDFKPNTKNALMGEEPLPLRLSNMEAAIEELKAELQDFVKAFEGQPDKRILNPFFGNMNRAEWIQLLHKHFRHHLRQFRLLD